METRYEDLLRTLKYQELMRLKGDVDQGGVQLKKFLEERVKRRLREHEKTCATCSGKLTFYTKSNYTLIFGPDDFKKKASFCGMDCLEYFMGKLKDYSLDEYEEEKERKFIEEI